jgi:hypothetical protein
MPRRERRRMRDQGHQSVFVGRVNCQAMRHCRQQVRGRDVQRGENAVHSRKRETAMAAQKIGKMRRAKTGLAGEKRDAERVSLNAAQQFQTKPVVKLSEIHLWKVCCQQSERIRSVFFLKT